MRVPSWTIPGIVFALGSLLAAGVALNLRQQEDETISKELAGQANQIGLLLQSTTSGFEASLAAVAGIGLVSEGDIAAMSQYIETADAPGIHAFLDLNGPRPVLLGVGSSSEVSYEERAQTRRDLRAMLQDPTLTGRLMALRDTGGFSLMATDNNDAIILAAVAADGELAYADLQRFPLGTAGLFVVNALGGIENFAVYRSSTPDPEAAIMSTVEQLPLGGKTRTASIQLAGEELLIEVQGHSTGAIPPLALGALGAAVSALLALSLYVSLRRRDDAVAALSAAHDADGRLRAALDASPDTVLLRDGPTNTVTLLNRESFFGHRVDPDFLTVQLPELVRPEDMTALQELLEGDVNGATGADIQITTAAGGPAWAHVRLSSIGDDADESGDEADDPDTPPPDLVIVVTDITDVLRTEGQRAQLEADLNQAQRMETIGQLAGGIAHDFNNLLAAISSTAELLATEITDPEMTQDIEEILAATHRGATLTKRLLTFSRRGVSSREVVEVGTVTVGLGDLLRRMLDERIELQIDTSQIPMPVQGDAGEIEQILLNLVVNARDAARGAGHLIQVRTEPVDGHARITVSDNGVGMPAEIRERAFEPFFTTKDADRGTGLGLSIVYGIASRMEGTVRIESEPGRGTSVIVDLPLQLAPQEVEADASVTDEVRTFAGGERVLLVEDEPAVCRAAQRLLEKAGHIVRAARDGREAIDILEDGFGPSVLVSDVILPGPLTGRDIADRARILAPGVRVVYASGYPRDVITSDQLIEEHVAFVSKPFTSHTLLAAVADHEEVPS